MELCDFIHKGLHPLLSGRHGPRALLNGRPSLALHLFTRGALQASKLDAHIRVIIKRLILLLAGLMAPYFRTIQFKKSRFPGRVLCALRPSGS